MPTIEIKDAKFSGTITYEDTSTPPTEPPIEPPSTVGKITNFSATNGSRIKVDNIEYGVHNGNTGNKPHTFSKVDDYELRFEIRQGDRKPNDSSDVERSSIQTTHLVEINGVTIQEYKLFIEPGQVVASWFFLLGQSHNCDSDMPYGGGTSPPVALELIGEKLLWKIRHCPSGKDPGNSAGNTKTIEVWKDTANVRRGVWINIKQEAKMSNGNDGYFKSWIDGVQKANYTGPMAFGYRTYWEYGPYRSTDPQTFACHYRNIHDT